MARKKPTYKCYKCKAKLGSAAVSFAHFQDNPNHRNAKQRKDYLANKALNRRGASTGPTGLPTRRLAYQRMDRSEKYCTECGTKKMPSHNFCGGCGGKM